MQIGCCENCRYVDMVENVGGECPRCGGGMIPVGVESVVWNRMSQKDKYTILTQLFREPEEEPETDTENEPEENKGPKPLDPIPDEALADESIFTPGGTKVVLPRRKTDTENTENTPEDDGVKPPEDDSVEAVADFVEKLFAEANGVEPEEDKGGEADGDGQTDEAAAETEGDEQDQDRQDPPKQNEKGIEYVYVCYRCNNIAGHDGSRNRYFCMDCGGDMVPVGCTAREWMELSKEEKRNAAEDAKIRHMVMQIKNANFDDSEGESTQNIINVV